MGGRRLRQWLQQPLINKRDIEDRLDSVEELIKNSIKSEEIKELLHDMYDLERLAGRIALGSANARDLLSLKQSLSLLPALKELLSHFNSRLLSVSYDNLDTLDDVYELLEKSIFEDPPVLLNEGNLIKSGWDKELDQYRLAITEGRAWIASLEQKEREKTGIKNLKIGFNKVMGYYIDVTKATMTWYQIII